MKIFPGLGNYPGLTLKATVNTIICFGYKVFGSDEKDVICAWDFPSWKKSVNSDKELIKKAFDILDKADAVVTHNGKKFDWKFLQTRLLVHDLKPLHKIPHIDTRQEASKNLFMFNNKLQTLGIHLVNDKKLDHEGWDLWVKVRQRDKDAMKVMKEYCMKDVLLLEKIFKELRPFMNNIPNYNLFTEGQTRCCPSCGSTRLTSNGYRATKTMSYKRIKCLDCGSSSRLDVSERLPRSI